MLLQRDNFLFAQCKSFLLLKNMRMFFFAKISKKNLNEKEKKNTGEDIISAIESWRVS